MSTITNALYSNFEDQICQGDVYKNVKYCYIESEEDDSVSIVEYEFPYALIISQACDVIAAEELIINKTGKATKFMPSVLMCPIYDKNFAKSGEHIEDIFRELSINIQKDNVYQKEDYRVAERDWHYRFHALTISVNKKAVMENAILDFKHYFTVPINYLINNKENRVLHIEDLYAEQLTLKFSTYLSRVAIP